jgi:hypothetical protein
MCATPSSNMDGGIVEDVWAEVCAQFAPADLVSFMRSNLHLWPGKLYDKIVELLCRNWMLPYNSSLSQLCLYMDGDSITSFTSLVETGDSRSVVYWLPRRIHNHLSPLLIMGVIYASITSGNTQVFTSVLCEYIRLNALGSNDNVRSRASRRVRRH